MNQQKSITERWRFKTGGQVRGSPAIDNHTVYVGSMDGNLYAIDRESGEERWRLETNSLRVHAPFVDDDTVYATSGEAVYAIDTTTGEEQWRFRDRRFIREPNWDKESIYVYASERDSWRLHAIDARSGNTRWTIANEVDTPHQLKTNVVVANDIVCVGTWRELHAFNTIDGSHAWDAEHPQIIESITNIDDVLLTGGRTTYVSPNIHAINFSDGSLRWATTTNPAEWITAVIAEGDTLYGSGIEPQDDGSKTRRVIAVNTADGTIRWTTITSQGKKSSVPPRPSTIDGDSLYIGGDRYVAVVDVTDGTVLDRFETDGEVHTKPAAEGGMVYVGSDDGSVYAFVHKS